MVPFTLFSLSLVLLLAPLARAFDNDRHDNLAVYWGQNSYGAGHLSDVANHQRRLSHYCNDDAIDVFPVGFLHVFFGTGDVPSINLANICGPADNGTFPGTDLANCSALATDIETCQAKGKLVTLSLGGATGAVGFKSDEQATTFAQHVWDMFLGGSSTMRPFGSAVLDGVDLDIEGGNSKHYGTFVNKLRKLSDNTGKKYYVTAAPQCVFPDAALGEVLNEVAFDAVYVQFYNNYCGLQNFDQASNWNFGTWDNWARSLSISKKTKVYLGAPAAKSAAGGGYVDAATLGKIATQMRKSFPSFGGVMMWDVSQAYANDRFDMAIKKALVEAGSTGFEYPPCSAKAFASGTGYAAGDQVSHDGYIWQAKWHATQTPSHGLSGEWSAVSVCGGEGSPAPSGTGSPTPSGSQSSDTATIPMTSASSTGPATPALPTITITSTSITRITTSYIPTATPSVPATSPVTTKSTSIITSTIYMTITTTSPISTATPAIGKPSGQCENIQTWKSDVPYLHDDKVVYKNHLWTAKWWSQADTPDSSAGVWTDNGPC